jgi:hypothetical protein
MSPGVKSLITSLLLTCFLVLIAAQSQPSLRSMRSRVRLRSPSPCHKLVSHTIEEVGGSGSDAGRPQDPELSGSDALATVFPVISGVPVRELEMVPFCSFWAGRMRRQIARAEPDDH